VSEIPSVLTIFEDYDADANVSSVSDQTSSRLVCVKDNKIFNGANHQRASTNFKIGGNLLVPTVVQVSRESRLEGKMIWSLVPRKGTISVETSKIWINLRRDVIYFVEYRETLNAFGGRLITRRTPSAFFTWLDQLSKDCYRQRVLDNYWQRHDGVPRPETSERLRAYNLERGCTRMIRHVAFEMQALFYVVILKF
jgi:hypothetical protein